jgi:hypothetical protein
VLHEGKYLEAVVTCRDRVHFLKSQHHEHLWYGLLLFMLYLNFPSTHFKDHRLNSQTYVIVLYLILDIFVNKFQIDCKMT